MGRAEAARKYFEKVLNRTKVAKLKPAKTPIKMEVGQLGQLFFEDCYDRVISFFWWDFEDLSAPYLGFRRQHMTAHAELRPSNDKAGTFEGGQVGQLQTCRNAYTQGTWPTYFRGWQ